MNISKKIPLAYILHMSTAFMFVQRWATAKSAMIIDERVSAGRSAAVLVDIMIFWR
jgi:hypothetical protein